MSDTSLVFNIIGRDKTGAATASASKHLGDFGKTAKLAALAVGGGVIAIGGSMIKHGIQTAAAMEQAQVGFTTLIGSAGKAQKFIGNLQKFAAATPFELPGLVDSSRTLLGVGVSAKDVIPMLTAFGDSAGAVGVGQEAFQRIMLATSQAISAGKFQTADLNQISTNGIPVWKILSEAMHKPVTKLREMATQGKLLSSDVLPILQKQMEKDYGGSMAKQSQTLSGVWSTLTDTINIGMANALQPLIPILEKDLPGAANVISQGIARFSQILAVLIPKVIAFANAITPVFKFIAAHKTLFTVLAAGVGSFVGTAMAVMKVVQIIKDMRAAMLVLNATMAANPAVFIAAAIIGLGVALYVAYQKSETFRKVVQAAFGAVKTAAETVYHWIKSHWPLLLAIITGPIGLAVYAVVKNFDRIKSAASAVKDFVAGKFTAVVDFVKGLPGKISRAASGMFDGIKNAFKSAINFIIGGWNGLHFGIPSIDTHIPGIGKIGGGSFGVPQIPYLAKGGNITRGGLAVVGEAGPELVSLNRGASVMPLRPSGRGVSGAQHEVKVTFDFTKKGAENALVEAIRQAVRTRGGDVQVAFGK